LDLLLGRPRGATFGVLGSGFRGWVVGVGLSGVDPLKEKGAGGVNVYTQRGADRFQAKREHLQRFDGL